MQILHPFAGPIQRYFDEIADPDRYRPDHCPQCEAKHPLTGRGFYGNLNDNRFVTGLCEVIPRWWFGVETTRWQSFQFRLVKLIAVPDMPCAGDYRRNPVVTMGVRCDACMCWHAKHNGINAWLVWIALQNDGLDSPYA
jgi:hypothetical protein